VLTVIFYITLTISLCLSSILLLIQGFDAGLANRPFLVFDFLALCRALNPELQSARKSKTKNGLLASPVSNPLVTVTILEL